MKIAGVVIDDWKLPIFKRHLDAAECQYTEHPGIAHGTLTLRVQYEWVSKLKPIIEAASKECAEMTNDPKTCLADGSAPSQATPR